MNDAIVDAANKQFASDYFEARQSFRGALGRPQLANP